MSNQLSNYADLITGERNMIRLNPMAKSCLCNGLKDLKKETLINIKKRCRNDAHNNTNIEQEEITHANAKIMLKKGSRTHALSENKTLNNISEIATDAASVP